MENNTSCSRGKVPVCNSSVNLQKDITEMNSLDLRAHFATSGEELSSKMGENFKCYVFIAASTGMQSLNEIIESMAFFAGYKMHKTVGCSKRIYHLYVKYETESIAIAARDYFRMKELSAELVYDMLHLWYAFEKAFGQTGYQTIGWLTLSDGTYPTSEAANKLLSKYGNPDIKVVEEGSITISFSSISEAFGACIALGPWYVNSKLTDSKYFTVKIELSEHCSRIMCMCNMTSVSNEFDYFVSSDRSVYSKINDNKTLHPHEIETSQKSNIHQNGFVKRPKMSGQKSQNYNKTLKKQNFKNIPLQSKQNGHPKTAHEYLNK